MCNASDGATWLGMSTNGRIRILTNYRQSEKFVKRSAKRRGKLAIVTDFLKSNDTPHKRVQRIQPDSG